MWLVHNFFITSYGKGILRYSNIAFINYMLLVAISYTIACFLTKVEKNMALLNKLRKKRNTI